MTRPPQAWDNRRGHAGGLAGGGRVLTTTLRLLARHWPVLLAIWLAGVLARELIMRAAVRVTLVNPDLGMLVLLLAPMATLTALVLMLRAVRPSLPWLGAGPDRPPPVLEHLGSVLIPFLTFYYLEGDLYADILDYAARVTQQDIERIFENLAESVAAGTELQAVDTVSLYELTPTLVAVVIGAFLARTLLSRLAAGRWGRWTGLPGAYLELVWTVLVLVVALEAVLELFGDWAGNRRLVNGAQTAWDGFTSRLSGDSSTGVVAWSAEQLARVDAVIVIPVAWLVIGGLVINHAAAPPPPLISEDGRLARAGRRWQAVPVVVRWPVDFFTGDLRARFSPLATNVRVLWRAGIVPVMLFCLAFVVARRIPDGLWELQRLVIGPQDVGSVWLPMSMPLGQVNTAIGQAVLVCLLAAAIDWMARATTASPANTQPSPAQSAGIAVPVLPPTGNRA